MGWGKDWSKVSKDNAKGLGWGKGKGAALVACSKLGGRFVLLEALLVHAEEERFRAEIG